MVENGWTAAVLNMIGNYTQVDGGIDYSLIVSIYCVNPQKDDFCLVGICPNPDIAGPLLRIAHYVTALCLTILIFHAPKRVKDAFYYQMSTVYALLITCSVSLFQENITRFHATVAIFIVSSPVSFYFLFYSIRAFWGEHRLDAVLGKKKYLNRGMIFFAAAIWITIIVYTSLKSTQSYFAQRSCDTRTMQEIFVLVVLNPRALGPDWLFLSPWFILAIIAAFSWLISIVLARNEIWPPGERYRPKFVTVWETIGRRYPFVFFISIGVVPISLWMWTTEMTMWFWQSDLSMVDGLMKFLGQTIINDSFISFSFGQILALFIAVPPFLQVCQLVPKLWPWFVNLTWIAYCWKRKRGAKQSAPTERPDLSYETVFYTQLENPVSSEVPNSQFDEGRQEMQESGLRLGPNQYYGS